MTRIRTADLLLYGAPCGHVFDNRYPCGAMLDHPVHRGQWSGPEPNHDFVPLERRSGQDRRNPRAKRPA